MEHQSVIAIDDRDLIAIMAAVVYANREDKSDKAEGMADALDEARTLLGVFSASLRCREYLV
jgi:hypothetical protein